MVSLTKCASEMNGCSVFNQERDAEGEEEMMSEYGDSLVRMVVNAVFGKGGFHLYSWILYYNICRKDQETSNH